MIGIELRDLRGIKRDILLLVRPKLHVLRELGFLDPPLQHALDRLVRAILEQRSDGQMSLLVGIYFGNYGWVSKSNWPTGPDLNIAKQPHVFVWRRGVPIHKGDREILVCWRKGLDGEHVLLPGERCFGHVEFVSSPRAGNIVRLRNLLPIQPDVGAIVDPAEIEPDRLALAAGRQDKRFPVPPGNDERVVLLHWYVRKVRAYRIRRSRNRTQVHAKRWIGIDLLLHQRTHDRCGYAHRVPTRGLKPGRGNYLAAFIHFAGRLE